MIPNTGRFEGFKASGKLGTIEDQDLQNAILDIYQETIPYVLEITAYQHEVKGDLVRYILANGKKNKDGNNLDLDMLLSSENARLSAIILMKTDAGLVSIYDSLTAKSTRVVKRIDEIYGPESEAQPSH
jgi:hypothetical protein